MVHIVQIVMWGVAEAPQLFRDEAVARSAYVACTVKRWEQRYTAYCEHHRLERDSFAAARDFVNSIDPSEKSSVNIWSLTPEGEECGTMRNSTGEAQREELRLAATEIAALRDGLTGIVTDVAQLSERIARIAGTFPEARPADEQTTAAPSPPTPPLKKPQPDPERYSRPEWKTLVGTVARYGSGPRNEFNLLPKESWRQAVYSNLTPFEYWEWVADSVMNYKELAMHASYSVIPVPEDPGDYRFTTCAGSPSEKSYGSELEAWCAAGLHAESNAGVETE